MNVVSCGLAAAKKEEEEGGDYDTLIIYSFLFYPFPFMKQRGGRFRSLNNNMMIMLCNIWKKRLKSFLRQVPYQVPPGYQQVWYGTLVPLPLNWGTLGVQKRLLVVYTVNKLLIFLLVQIRVEIKKRLEEVTKVPFLRDLHKRGSLFQDLQNTRTTKTHRQNTTFFQHDSAKPSPSDDAHQNITSRASTLK